MLKVTLGNGTSSTTAYDNQGALASLKHDLTGTAQDQTYSYTRNQAGEITTHSWSNDAYQWAGVPGNAVNGSKSYTSNGLNQYTAVTGGTATTPSYDALGNFKGDGTWSYTYNRDDQLTAATKGGAQAVNAALYYDGAGRLRKSVINTTTIALAYDGVDLVAEYDSAGALLRRYVHGPGTDEPLVVYEGSGTSDKRWLYADHLGSIVGAANAAGTSTALYSYGPYGEPGTTGGTGGTGATNSLRFRYTGQQYIEELGLYYYKARFYSPALGRFLQTDPIGVADDLNLYAYVGGNPINRIDPRGLSSQEASLLNGTLAGGAVIVAGGSTQVLGQIFQGWGRVGLTIPPLVAAPIAIGVGLLTFPSTIADGTLDGNGWTFNNGANDRESTLRPGPNAGESIPARGPERDFTPDERQKINDIGNDTGCHTCGTKTPGTKTGNWIPDHQPANGLNTDGGPQRLYPHCLGCSRIQGGQVTGAGRRGD